MVRSLSRSAFSHVPLKLFLVDLAEQGAVVRPPGVDLGRGPTVLQDLYAVLLVLPSRARGYKRPLFIPSWR